MSKTNSGQSQGRWKPKTYVSFSVSLANPAWLWDSQCKCKGRDPKKNGKSVVFCQKVPKKVLKSTEESTKKYTQKSAQVKKD